MKILIILVLLIASVASCTEMRSVSITARPDPNTATSGTLGSVKATDGILPLQDYGSPRP